MQTYENSTNVESVRANIPVNYQEFISQIAKNCFQSKGVYTALITLLVHKTLNPSQDIRIHQAQIGGFSGRTIDTHYITPTLQELGLPAMAESGRNQGDCPLPIYGESSRFDLRAGGS